MPRGVRCLAAGACRQEETGEDQHTLQIRKNMCFYIRQLLPSLHGWPSVVRNAQRLCTPLCDAGAMHRWCYCSTCALHRSAAAWNIHQGMTNSASVMRSVCKMPCLQKVGTGASHSPGRRPSWVCQAQGRSALPQVRLLAWEACMLAVHGPSWCRTCLEPGWVAPAVTLPSASFKEELAPWVQG